MSRHLRRRPTRWAALLLLCLASLTAAADVPVVVASNKPLHSLLTGLMQGVGAPVLLIDSPAAPWTYTPDAADRAALAQADLVAWSGRELEPSLAPLIAAGSDPAVVFEVLASELIKILPARHDPTLRDPFYWLDTRNMLILLDALAEQLVAIDPDRGGVYRRNWQRLAASLGAIDRTLEFGYRDVSGVPVFFYHDTHQYFEQAYAMHVAASVLPAGQGHTQPDTARLLEVRSRMAAGDRTCLFTEKGLDAPHLDLLLAGNDVVTVELDSLGTGLQPGPELYPELMRRNFDAISRCVKAVRPELAQDAAASPVPVPDVRAFPDRVRPRYVLQDQFGRTVSVDDFRGRLQVIYFGYTFCPDICPTGLGTLARALTLLGDAADEIQPIFITVDPQRDTPELLAQYVRYFHPGMLALSGSPEATKRTAELFRARYEVVPSESGNPDRYTMDHTASLYVLGRDGEFLTKLAHGLSAQDVAARLRQHLDGGPAG